MPNKFIVEIPNSDHITVQVQDWDTQLLNRACASLVDFSSAQEGISNKRDYGLLLEKLKELRLQYVVARRPENEWSRIRALEKVGFELVDGIVSMRCPLSSIKLAPLSAHARLARPEDTEAIANLSSAVFKQGRFFNDPLITLDQATQVHFQWARNSCLGRVPAVWVIEQKQIILGFVTCKIEERIGIIELIGVKKEAAGQGLGQDLMAAACHWFFQKQCSEVQVQTQTSNYQAINLYIKCQFRPFANSLTLRWAP